VGLLDGAAGINPNLTSGQIEIAYALYGDITLQGSVSGTDFALLAKDFGHLVTGGWEQGDFNYDGAVNATDFGLLAGNFGKTATIAPLKKAAAIQENSVTLIEPSDEKSAARAVAGVLSVKSKLFSDVRVAE
jgi:hypothetical protein